MAQHSEDPPLTVPLGRDRLVVERRYETLSILNDFAIGLWFLVGSVLFFFKPLETWAITCFVLGSLQFVVRPTIRLHRRIYLRDRREDHDESYDY